jgi:Flp pilus assembly protein TadG
MLATRDGQRGGALVEFAMILPLALVFLLGIIEFGITTFEYHSINFAAKFGARYASVHGKNCTASNCPITVSELQTAVRKAVPGAGNATVTATWTAPPATTYPGMNDPALDCSASSEETGCFVIVTVTSKARLDIPFLKNETVNFKSTSQTPVSQ